MVARTKRKKTRSADGSFPPTTAQAWSIYAQNATLSPMGNESGPKLQEKRPRKDTRFYENKPPVPRQGCASTTVVFTPFHVTSFVAFGTSSVALEPRGTVASGRLQMVLTSGLTE